MTIFHGWNLGWHLFSRFLSLFTKVLGWAFSNHTYLTLFQVLFYPFAYFPATLSRPSKIPGSHTSTSPTLLGWEKRVKESFATQIKVKILQFIFRPVGKNILIKNCLYWLKINDQHCVISKFALYTHNCISPSKTNGSHSSP